MEACKMERRERKEEGQRGKTRKNEDRCAGARTFRWRLALSRPWEDEVRRKGGTSRALPAQLLQHQP